MPFVKVSVPSVGNFISGILNAHDFNPIMSMNMFSEGLLVFMSGFSVYVAFIHVIVVKVHKLYATGLLLELEDVLPFIQKACSVFNMIYGG